MQGADVQGRHQRIVDKLVLDKRRRGSSRRSWHWLPRADLGRSPGNHLLAVMGHLHRSGREERWGPGLNRQFLVQLALLVLLVLALVPLLVPLLVLVLLVLLLPLFELNDCMCSKRKKRGKG